MGDTRRPSSLDGGRGRAHSQLTGALDRALDALPVEEHVLAVALSGGPDSSALAILAAQRAQLRGIALHVFHVHHGLHENADRWAATAQALSHRLNARFWAARVDVNAADPKGIEAAAREARYDALAKLAHEAGLRYILLAHHQDDQVETVMFRLLRGAGLDGMGAMSDTSQRDGVTYLRPWLHVPRARIIDIMQAYSAQTGFEPVRDPSNHDVQFARGALRVDVLPSIERHWPGYRGTLERFARLAVESASVLHDIAVQDLDSVRESEGPFTGGLRLSLLRQLSEPRQKMVLRRWLGDHGLAMPSEARLQELQRQLSPAEHDGHMVLRHGEVFVRRYRDWAVVDAGQDSPEPGGPVALQWNGEACLRVDEPAGSLRFIEADEGIDAQWLRGAPLFVRRRSGREKLKLSAQTPGRTLKNLYQEHGIPVWQRERLPLVYRQDMLVFAAGLGADIRAPQAEPGIRLEWVADLPGAHG